MSRYVLLAACLLLTACQPHDSKTPVYSFGVGQAQPVNTGGNLSPVAPAPSTDFTLTVFSGNNQKGALGQPLTEPLVVEVRDATGRLCDNVYVMFQAETLGKVLGLGSETSGDGYYVVTPPGSGRAGATAIPAALTPQKVKAYVLPTPASSSTPANSSNVVEFTVTGQ